MVFIVCHSLHYSLLSSPGRSPYFTLISPARLPWAFEVRTVEQHSFSVTLPCPSFSGGQVFDHLINQHNPLPFQPRCHSFFPTLSTPADSVSGQTSLLILPALCCHCPLNALLARARWRLGFLPDS